jgi:UDP-glucose 4-epimerase
VSTALVTGGAGFIGSHIVDRLLGKGMRVAVIDNLSSGYRENVNADAVLHEADIRDAERVRAIFGEEKPEVVFHLAAQMDVRKSVADPVYDAQCNVIGSLNLLEACKATGTRKFVFSSTGGVIYGEPNYLPVREDHATLPMCPYGAAKRSVETYLHMYQENFGVGYTVLRYGNVYGPRQDPHGEAGVIAIFSQMMLSGDQPRIFGDGSQTRDYVNVRDVVEANMLAMDGGNGRIFNVGTAIGTPVLDIFNYVKAATGYPGEPLFAPERVGEISRISLDVTYIGEELGWKPTLCLAEGVPLAVDFYRAKLRL